MLIIHMLHENHPPYQHHVDVLVLVPAPDPEIAMINVEEAAADPLVIHVEGHDLVRDHLPPKEEVVHQDPDHPDVIGEVVHQEKRNPTQRH